MPNYSFLTHMIGYLHHIFTKEVQMEVSKAQLLENP